MYNSQKKSFDNYCQTGTKDTDKHRHPNTIPRSNQKIKLLVCMNVNQLNMLNMSITNTLPRLIRNGKMYYPHMKADFVYHLIQSASTSGMYPELPYSSCKLLQRQQWYGLDGYNIEQSCGTLCLRKL